jgi:hypothetical protein
MQTGLDWDSPDDPEPQWIVPDFLDYPEAPIGDMDSYRRISESGPFRRSSRHFGSNRMESGRAADIAEPTCRGHAPPRLPAAHMPRTTSASSSAPITDQQIRRGDDAPGFTGSSAIREPRRQRSRPRDASIVAAGRLILFIKELCIEQ